jgi:glycine oxidase
MANKYERVVVIGAGVSGLSTAYYLALAGLPSMVVERDAIGSHASGFAYGSLRPLEGSGIPGPVFPLARDGFRLNRELALVLRDETGIDVEWRRNPALGLAFAEEEEQLARLRLAWQRENAEYAVSWLEPVAVRSLEPRVAPDVRGAVYQEGTADVEAYKLSLALATSAEKHGATLRHGRVVGLKRERDRVTGVMLTSGEISCDCVVLALGPWSAEASAWLDLPIPVRPLKGQILRLQALGRPLNVSLGWAGSYATSKTDGLIWTGTTEEEAGFDDQPTETGRDAILATCLRMLPALGDARIVLQTACLRPVAADGLPIIGPVPGLEGAFLLTGAGRKGILLGPAMGRCIADLILNRKTDQPIDAFSPTRFGASS